VTTNDYPPTEARLKAVRRLAHRCGWQLQWNGDACRLIRRVNGTTERIHAEGKHFGLSLDEAESKCWEMRPEFAPRESHPLYAKLEQLAAEYGGRTQDWAVMSSKSDPFLMDTDTNHGAALWLKELLDSHRITVLHDRGVHYVLVSTDGLMVGWSRRAGMSSSGSPSRDGPDGNVRELPACVDGDR
jgi:hypothetical protein